MPTSGYRHCKKFIVSGKKGLKYFSQSLLMVIALCEAPAVQVVVIKVTFTENNGFHYTASPCGEKSESSTCRVTCYAFQWSLHADMQNYHQSGEEGNGKPPYSLIGSGSLFISV